MTPVNVKMYEKLLKETGYRKGEMEHLLKGFTQGFELGFEGPQDCQLTARNLPLRCDDSNDVWDKVMKETKFKHFAGPHKKIPFKYYIQSAMGLVPKHQTEQVEQHSAM